MADEVKDASEVEQKDVTSAGDSKPEEKKQEKVGDIFGKKTKPEPKLVPEAVLIREKQARKAAEAELERLRNSGATGEETDKTLEEIAEKFNVDPDLIKVLDERARKNAAEVAGEQVKSELKPLTDKEEATRLDKIFKENYEKTLTEMPAEFKEVVDEKVVKLLCQQQENADKTFEQIIREQYERFVKGKKTLDTNSGGGNKGGPQKLDFEKAGNDPEYFKEVMSDPALRAEYNGNLHKNLKL